MADGDLERIFRAFELASVRYLVVGGVAVVLHGHLRFTADLDLVIHLQEDNARRALEALGSLGFRPRAPVAAGDFANAAVRDSWVAEKGLTVLSFWSPDFAGTEVDLFVQEPFDFDETDARALTADLGSTKVRVVSKQDLIAMKRAAGPQGHRRCGRARRSRQGRWVTRNKPLPSQRTSALSVVPASR